MVRDNAAEKVTYLTNYYPFGGSIIKPQHHKTRIPEYPSSNLKSTKISFLNSGTKNNCSILFRVSIGNSLGNNPLITIHLTPMKKKLTTNFSRFCKAVQCLFFLFIANALVAQITLDTATTAITKTINCGSTTTFTDNNLAAGGLYFDDAARKDTIILCPNTSGSQLKVNFTAFDVAGGDRLIGFDGDIKKNPGANSQVASGNSISNAFGGWIQANCNPANNPTGCLSFVFETNGDRTKGSGWSASITCENDGIVVNCPSNVSATDDCNNLDGMVTIAIPRPTFTSCNGTINPMVKLTSNCTAIPERTVAADGSTDNFTIPLGMGNNSM